MTARRLTGSLLSVCTSLESTVTLWRTACHLVTTEQALPTKYRGWYFSCPSWNWGLSRGAEYSIVFLSASKSAVQEASEAETKPLTQALESRDPGKGDLVCDYLDSWSVGQDFALPTKHEVKVPWSWQRGVCELSSTEFQGTTSWMRLQNVFYQVFLQARPCPSSSISSSTPTSHRHAPLYHNAWLAPTPSPRVGKRKHDPGRQIHLHCW